MNALIRNAITPVSERNNVNTVTALIDGAKALFNDVMLIMNSPLDVDDAVELENMHEIVNMIGLGLSRF